MMLESGARLGPYEIVSFIGAGGMGEVYRARDTRLDRAVAIKLLPAVVAHDAERLQRFHREAKAASALNHPNILTIYDVDTEHPQTPYMAAELVEGETLRQRLTRGALPVNEAIAFASQVAAALATAHGAGIIHRDVKPENVMVRRDGLVKLLDFGLAKLLHATADLDETRPHVPGSATTPGLIVGTTRYMSPEQARGLTLDCRSDIFSFGALLYEMLTDQLPFDAPTSTDVLLAIIDRDPPPLAVQRPDVPRDLQEIVERCLEKARDRRYPSGRELFTDLQRLHDTGRVERKTNDARPAIAVLPFINMSADPENEFFCDGLAEELINMLSKVDGLQVAARTSTFSFKGKGADVRSIGRALGVNTILEGSVRRASARIRIAVQLVDVANGYQLWSNRYDRQLEDIFAIQDEIALAIADALRVKLLGDEKAALGKRHTHNVEAYQQCLRGRHFWHKWTEGGIAKARECFERAIQIDPDYALAYLGLADVHAVGSSIGTPPLEVAPRVKSLLAKTLALDPDLADAWVLLGVSHLWYDWNWVAAEHALTRAIQLNPRSGHAHIVLAQLRFFHGRFDEGLAAARRGVELDPLAPFWHYILFQAYCARREWDRAVDQIRALLDIDETFWMGYFGRGLVLSGQGHHSGAVDAFEGAVRCSHGNPYATGQLAAALARAGRRDDAERHLSDLEQRQSDGWVPALSLAFAHLGLSGPHQVFEWLERAYEERDGWLSFHIQYDPAFDAIRSDPRLVGLLRRMGFTHSLARGNRLAGEPPADHS